jgi:hypothetical protein
MKGLVLIAFLLHSGVGKESELKWNIQENICSLNAMELRKGKGISNY